MSGSIPSWEHYGTHDDSAYPELWEGCVGAWAPCLGPTGFALFDLSITRNDGQLVSMESEDWKVSGTGYCLDFGGTPERITTSRSGPLGQTARSISAWVNTANPNTILGYGQNSLNARFQFGLATTTTFGNTLGQPWVEINGTLSGGGPAALGAWTHVGCTYSGGPLATGLRLYHNGKGYAPTNGAGAGTPNTFDATPIGIAYEPTISAGHLVGQLDDCRIYDRVISAGEMELLAVSRGVAYTPRRPRRFYSLPPSFLPAWARNRVAHIIGGGLR